MNRKQLKLSSLIGIAALMVTASLAQAAVDNPLAPAYYSQKITLNKSAPAWMLIPYVDSGNPLHPSFDRADSKWQEAVAIAGGGYTDRRNPLHPSYQKNQ